MTMKIQFADLMQQQGSHSAVLPVHTAEEKAFYQMLIQRKDGYFSGNMPPDWFSIVQDWSAHSDGIKIFYKVLYLLAHWLDEQVATIGPKDDGC